MSQTPHRVLLLGEEERDYGGFNLVSLPSDRVACSLSVGADPTSPSLLHKGRDDCPNEDGLFVMESEDRVLLAVADAHFGVFASHAMLQRFQDILTSVPVSPAALVKTMRGMAITEPLANSDLQSATSLLVAVLRRDMHAGFGLSYGDSSCAALGGAHHGRPLNRPNESYVNPAVPESLAPERAAFFDFDVSSGGLLLAFTDGIDRCHYERPATSVTPRHFEELFREVGPQPEAYARRLTQLALSGVDGNPGGQDNLALIVAAT